MSTSEPMGDPVVLAGSERDAAPQARAEQTPPGAPEPLEVTLILRRRRAVPDSVFAAPLGREEFGRRYGADPADVDAVIEAVRALGADVVEADAASRRVRIRHDADTLAGIFGTTLAWVSSLDHGGNRVAHRQRTGPLTLPDALQHRVLAVLGLDDRPTARAHFRVASPDAVTQSYTPPQLGQIYDFPPGTDGAGRTIAIIELGGGFADTDLDPYFASLGLAVPSVTAVGVDGATNVPGRDPTGADGEVLLDIEVAGSLAPAASLVVYFAPNTDAGFVDAVSRAAHADPTPDAMSISWGQSEDTWTPQGRNALDAAILDAAGMGVTVTVAAGDNGSSDRENDGKPHVDFPASSPHGLACGGTSLIADAATGVVASETVWDDLPSGGATGGGVSDVFPRPAWQQVVGVPGSGRGVPDLDRVTGAGFAGLGRVGR